MILTGPAMITMKLIIEIARRSSVSVRLEMQIPMGTLTKKVDEEQQPCHGWRWVVMERAMQSQSHCPGTARETRRTGRPVFLNHGLDAVISQCGGEESMALTLLKHSDYGKNRA